MRDLRFKFLGGQVTTVRLGSIQPQRGGRDMIQLGHFFNGNQSGRYAERSSRIAQALMLR